MNTEQKIYKNYISTHFGSFHNFDKEINHVYKLFRKNYLKFLPDDKNVRIVDLGCGMGHFLYFLNRVGYKNYLGIDTSQENIEFCISKNFQVVEADIFDFLSSDIGIVDIFILNDLFEHFVPEVGIELLELIHKNLSPGGRVIIKTPNGASPFLAGSSMYQDITHKFCYTQVSLSQILNISGFKNIKIVPQDIYIFSKNPLNYVAKFTIFLLNSLLRLIFFLYGKWTITIFDKHLIASAERN